MSQKMWSRLLEAGGNTRFILITRTGKFPFRDGAARSWCARSWSVTRSRGLTLDRRGRNEDRARYLEQQSVVTGTLMAIDDGKLDRGNMRRDAWPNYTSDVIKF